MTTLFPLSSLPPFPSNICPKTTERENTSVVGRSHGSPRLVKTPLVRSTPSTLWQVTPKENTDPRVEPHSDKKSTCNKQQRQSTLEPIGSERRQHLRHQQQHQQHHLVFNSTVSQKPNMMTIQTTALDPPVLKSKPKLEEPFKPDSELDSSSSELIPNRDSSFTWAGNGPGFTNMGLLTSPLPPSLTSNRQTVSKPIITLPLHHQRRRRPTLLRSNGGHGSSFSGSSCLSSQFPSPSSSSSSPSCFNYPNSLSLPELGFPEEQEEESGGGGVFIFDDLSPLISISSSSSSSFSPPLSSSYTPLDPTTTTTTTSPTKLSISQYTSLLRTLRSKNPSYPKMPSMLNPLRQRAPYMFQVGVEPNTRNPYCGLSWNFQKPLYCYRKQQHKSFGNGNGNGSLKSDRSCRGWNGNGNGNNNKVSGKGDGDGGLMRSRSACTQSNRNLRETSYISSGDHHHCVPCKRDTLCKRLLIAKYWRMRDQATAAAEDRMQSVPRDVGDSSDEEQEHDHLSLDVDEDGDVRMRGSGYMNDVDLDLGGPNDPDVVVDITSSLAEELKRTRTKARARTSMSMSMSMNATTTTTTRRPLLKSTHGRDRVVGGGGGGGV
ncbi:hypothetical protein K435DRAFT_422792 [Dendrothele bispora CBS 962.96]|uniref:Uncharacterized protein n=1 Tax=Dendrothele bispora (strain CBS 962.96) TaxID=1314807 RepID=A0A4S8MES3_DENBC|nr:hypothetical protein K435DRAFT_422792 [Dendrothele bispora CBS 962.96]